MKFIVLLLICGIAQFGYSQNRLNFKSLRYDEQYSKMVNDTNMTFLDKIKFIPLSKDESFIMSLGGELRAQYQYFKNEQWGDLPEDTNGFLLNRALLHVDTKYREKLRLFVQLQSSLSISRIDPSPIDKNELDIHQFFVDYRFHLNADEITLRVGRQEFMYGSQRLVAVREGPNSRQSFDAVKMIWKARNLQTDIFYSQFVRNVYGSFNDRMNSDTKLYGIYNMINKVPVLKNIEIYYFGLHKEFSSFNNVSGEEKRHTVGSRIWGNIKDWNYDFETVYQFGEIDSQSIEAWTVSINTNYQFNTFKFKPKLGIKTEIISGDKSDDDNKMQTFNPLFPRGAYFGLGAFLGPSNLYDIHPYIELEITDRIIFGGDYDLFWRLSKNDGIYQTNTELLYPSGNSSLYYIGYQLGAFMDYDILKNLSFKLEFTYFNAGSYLKDVSSGKDILFTAATLCYRF